MRRGALVVTASNRDRRELNERIRRGLKKEHALGPDQLRSSVLVRKDLTAAEAKERVEADRRIEGGGLRG